METIDEPAAKVMNNLGQRSHNPSPADKMLKPKLIRLKKKQKRTIYRPDMGQAQNPTLKEHLDTMENEQHI